MLSIKTNTFFLRPYFRRRPFLGFVAMPSVGRPKKFFQMEKPPVLCFYGYFKDAVHESAGENYRVHKCNIFYYTEDDSIEVRAQAFVSQRRNAGTSNT